MLWINIVHGQDMSLTQQQVNLPSVNAGFVGIDNFLNIRTGYRQGLQNVDKGSLTFLSMYSSFQKNSEYILKNNALRLSQQATANTLNSDIKTRRKHGVGGEISKFSEGAFSSTKIDLSYAYHIPVSKKVNWSMGLTTGILNNSVSLTGLSVRDEANDLFFQELLTKGNGNQLNMTFNFGSAVYSNNFYFGVSSTGLIESPISENLGLELTSLKGYNFVAGALLDVGQDLEFYPSAMIKYTDFQSATWSASTRIRYKEVVSLGVSYFSETKISVLLGLNVKYWSLNYAYDSFNNGLNTVNTNVHEVVLGISIFDKYAIRSKFW
jgi:type IX secretion system PorP/SprF family membrane protein